MKGLGVFAWMDKVYATTKKKWCYENFMGLTKEARLAFLSIAEGQGRRVCRAGRSSE